MIVCDYCPKYENDLQHLLESHALSIDLIKKLPKVGKVVFNDQGKIIGAGFLRFIEGHFGMIDGLITNPVYPGRERSEALDLLIDDLKKESKKLGLSKVIGVTGFQSLIERGVEKHGFVWLEHRLVVHHLGGNM